MRIVLCDDLQYIYESLEEEGLSQLYIVDGLKQKVMKCWENGWSLMGSFLDALKDLVHSLVDR